MLKIKLLIYSSLLLVGFLGSYLLNNNLVSERPLLEKSPSSIKLESQKIPECFLGICPKYFSIDVDADGLAESVVIIPTRMTQGAGKVWIIDAGKVVFESAELPGVWVEEDKEGKGFFLLHRSEPNSGKTNKVRYVFREGKFTKEEN